MENSFDSIPIISHDDTIIEVLDKKWKKFLIPRINILKAKYTLISEPSEKLINIPDKDGKIQQIMESIL